MLMDKTNPPQIRLFLNSLQRFLSKKVLSGLVSLFEPFIVSNPIIPDLKSSQVGTSLPKLQGLFSNVERIPITVLLEEF